MSATKAPVIEDKSFMKKYQDVDDNYNTMMDSNKLFLSKYDLELNLNGKTFPLTTEDIKYSQRVIEKISQHKDILKVGQNDMKIIISDKITKDKKDATIELVITKVMSNDSDVVLKNENFQNSNGVNSSTFELKEANNWIITGSFTVDGIVGYIYIKTNAI